MAVNPISEGFNSLNAYLVVKDARKAMDFYSEAFGGVGGCCLTAPDGSVMHAEVRIGNSTLMLSQENPNWPQFKSAETMGGSPVGIHLCVPDVDAAFEKAIAAGCEVAQPVDNMFWGDRFGKVKDPFGYEWSIATHIEDMTPEEMQRRGNEWFQQMASQEQ